MTKNADATTTEGQLSEEEMERLVRQVDAKVAARKKAEERELLKLATSPKYPGVLRDAFDIYSKQHQFSEGELVQWKPMMRDRRFPLEGVPAIAIRYIDPPLTVDYEGDVLDEPWDLLVGMVDGRSVLRTFAMCSNRLMPWTE